ncbi:MAG TPA: DUF268 domain-containing protein [Solirubrobacteraceae bacterium]|jgi:SAM-dependent methyltransferase|nr:DUF268 domain-containing protein [Solirubrobacteraceae bacterium]
MASSTNPRHHALKLLGRRLLRPLLAPIDGRVADINRRVASSTRQTREALAWDTRQVRDGVVTAVDAAIATYVEAQRESAAFVGAQMRALESTLQELREDAEAQRAYMEAAVGHLHDVKSLVEALRADLEGLGGELASSRKGVGPTIVGDYLRRLTDGKLADLDRPTAEFLNYAGSHRGFAAQAELWVNPPLVLEHREGDVRLATVNERIVEVPFALSAIGRLQPGARVLDFGSSESSLALSLASLGFEVTALDLRPYPFEHPQLDVVVSAIETWASEPGRFDAVLCVSTLEHVGLGWYGDPRHEAEGDRQALARLSDLLAPGGLLVLTLPYGARSVDSLQRRYDREQLDNLIEGWEIVERSIVEQVDDRTWRTVDDSADVAVALVTARKPGVP